MISRALFSKHHKTRGFRGVASSPATGVQYILQATPLFLCVHIYIYTFLYCCIFGNVLLLSSFMPHMWNLSLSIRVLLSYCTLFMYGFLANGSSSIVLNGGLIKNFVSLLRWPIFSKRRTLIYIYIYTNIYYIYIIYRYIC